jgi:uncharacterized membrane protein
MTDLENLYTTLTKNLHFIYLLFAVPLIYFTITEIPPFQNPDEPNHFARAEQVSRFEMVPQFVYDDNSPKNPTDPLNPDLQLPPKGGFIVNKGIVQLAKIYHPLNFHYLVKASMAKADSAKNIKWNTGLTRKNFSNTAIYPPFVYIMPALSICIGKLVNLSVIKTFYIGRMLNALLSVAVCFIALLLAKRSKLLLFTILLFPMTIEMFSSVSKDAVLISAAFLFVGIIDNIESSPITNYSKTQKYLLIILMCIVGIAKPPYILFSLVFLFLKLDRKTKIAGIIVPFVLMFIWLYLVSADLSIKGPGVDLTYNSKLQVAYIIHHPFKFIGLFFNYDTNGIEFVFKMIVGVLGWMDLQFPIDYYHTAYIVAFIAFISTFNFSRFDNLKLRLSVFIIAFITLLAVITSQYVIWTPLYATYLGGMQGRYVTPVLPFLALSLCFSTKEETITKFKSLAIIPVLLFPVFTFIVTADGIINRYYFH